VVDGDLLFAAFASIDRTSSFRAFAFLIVSVFRFFVVFGASLRCMQDGDGRLTKLIAPFLVSSHLTTAKTCMYRDINTEPGNLEIYRILSLLYTALLRGFLFGVKKF
jgi:hypothetical protein